MKIKSNKLKTFIKFKGKITKGQIYYDGSGYLEIRKNGWQFYCAEDGKHEHRVEDIKNKYLLYKKAYNEIKNIKYKKILNGK